MDGTLGVIRKEGQSQENVGINKRHREKVDLDTERVNKRMFVKEESNGDIVDEAIDGIDEVEYEEMDDESDEVEDGGEVDPFEGVEDIDTKLSMIMKTLNSQNKLIRILLERTQASSSSSSSSSLNARYNLPLPKTKNRIDNLNPDSDVESEETILDYTDDNCVRSYQQRPQPMMKPSHLNHRPKRVCLYEGCGIDIMNRGSRARYCEHHSKILRNERAKAHNIKAREDRAMKAPPRRCAVCSIDISSKGVRALYCDLHSVNMSKVEVHRPTKTRICAQPGCGVTFTLRHGFYRTLYCDHHRALRSKAHNKVTMSLPKTACIVKNCAKKGCGNKFEINGVGKGKGSYRTKYCLEHRTNAHKRDLSGNLLYVPPRSGNVYKRSRHNDNRAEGDLEGFMQRRIDNFLQDEDIVASADFLDDGLGTHVSHPHLSKLRTTRDDIEDLDDINTDGTNILNGDQIQGIEINKVYDPFVSSTTDHNDTSHIENGNDIDIHARYVISPPARTTVVPSIVRVLD